MVLRHTELAEHDGYEPHSHVTRQDHYGVTREDQADPASGPDVGQPTPEDHVAEAERLLASADALRRRHPPDVLGLAVLALAHTMTALAAAEFPAEGGSGTDEAAALALYRTQNPSFEPLRPGTPTRFTPLHKQIVFWLAGPGVAPNGWTVRWLAQQTGHLDTEVLAELESMEDGGLVRQSRPGYWSLPDTEREA